MKIGNFFLKSLVGGFCMLVGLNIMNQRFRCGVNVLYLCAKRENFSTSFELQSSFQFSLAL